MVSLLNFRIPAGPLLMVYKVCCFRTLRSGRCINKEYGVIFLMAAAPFLKVIFLSPAGTGFVSLKVGVARWFLLC